MRYIPSHLHEILWSKMPSGGRFSSKPLSHLHWRWPILVMCKMGGLWSWVWSRMLHSVKMCQCGKHEFQPWICWIQAGTKLNGWHQNPMNLRGVFLNSSPSFLNSSSSTSVLFLFLFHFFLSFLFFASMLQCVIHSSLSPLLPPQLSLGDYVMGCTKHG